MTLVGELTFTAKLEKSAASGGDPIFPLNSPKNPIYLKSIFDVVDKLEFPGSD